MVMNIRELELLAALTSDEEHTRPEEIDAFVAGTATPSLRSRIESHAETCTMCSRELQDLRKLNVAPALEPARIAAAILLGLLVLAPFVASRIRETADRRYAAVSIPRDITSMKGERLLLRGASTTSELAVLEPLATAVVSERPTFRWTAPSDAVVSVQVFDENFNPIVRSAPVHAQEWIPEQALPRGKTLIWQIVVEDGSGRRLAPAPPLPDARFRVVSDDDARRLSSLVRRTSKPTLRLASAYVEAGALDDARRELMRLQAAGRMTDASRRLLEKVDNLQ
jgi:hypothetical protein